MKLKTRQALMFVMEKMTEELGKERGRNDQLRRELAESDAKVADLVERMDAVEDDLRTC